MRRQSTLTLGIPLDGGHSEAVHLLARRLGLPEERMPAYPHVSVLVLLEVPDAVALDAAVREVASRTSPFTVRARGLGVFDDGDGALVLHVPVVRTDALATLHHDLHGVATAAGARVDGHSTPSAWFPHVTLCDRGAGAVTAARAVAALAGGPPIAWTLPVSDLALLDRAGPSTVIRLG